MVCLDINTHAVKGMYYSILTFKVTEGTALSIKVS